MSNRSNQVYEFRNGSDKITVEKIETGKGERIEIRSAETGESIRLDPLELESLTWQDQEDLSAILDS